MDNVFYSQLSVQSLGGEVLDGALCRRILTDPRVELLPLLNAAYEVRKHFHGKEVAIHILNNAANGYCPEDCSYCAQSKYSQAGIEEYPLKSDGEILAEARAAHEAGAFRYCMVFAGRGPSERRVEKICSLIRQIKEEHPLEVCVSAGLMGEAATAKLKEAGLDRLNHNLNTSRDLYPEICTTHTYDDRLATLLAAKNVGLEVCSGIIAGMGETPEDLIDLALQLREISARSIPINFLLPIKGNPLQKATNLTPEYCLRILCLFRFLNPDAEIRAAAGREHHLRDLEVFCLYPANSIFLQGYLNTQGRSDAQTLQMIKDAGFTIKSDVPLDHLLESQPSEKPAAPRLHTLPLKSRSDLHASPAQSTHD